LKTRLTFFLVLSLAVAGAAIAACGGDEELTFEQYFEGLQSIVDDGALDPRLDTSEANDVADVHELFVELTGIFRDGLRQLDNLRPPGEIQDEHNVFVHAGFAVFDEANGMIKKIKESDSFEEALGVLTGTPDYDNAQAEFSAACAALEAAALERDIQVDLDCA